MRKIRVAINGFGRIGRQVLQAGIADKNIEWVAVNNRSADIPSLAYLLKYDSVHGKSPYKVSYDKKHVVLNGKKILVLSVDDPAKLPWKQLKIDVVAECTGAFTDREGAAKHLKAGAKKVLISAPAKNPDITIVKGVNHEKYDASKHHVVSNASCTTNCLAPLVKVLNDAFGVKHGFMNTAHSYTADQALVDGQHHKDPRRGRSAAVSIIPTTTGAAKTVAETIPELKGLLDGLAIRVPCPDGSIANFVADLNKKVTIKQINAVFKKAAQTSFKGIIEYCDEPIVSRDIIHNSHSCIFDALTTDVVDDTLISVNGWYDNEWGYSCRMVDVIKLLMKK
ncbi:type I glyceraldehyde-3-phosphate dehydrogenase [Candidatus Woesearchaeota archaeon CG10_big_fil_rev_8_21_14_0_10_37_12]|nr:MAG: type I glyceraldehyde-3-phosphate dehydrogenase [Candidatus Woesearchaeota archaeon CG10_big_fil_rev_8_21_14_0_10_37_12]